MSLCCTQASAQHTTQHKASGSHQSSLIRSSAARAPDQHQTPVHLSTVRICGLTRLVRPPPLSSTNPLPTFKASASATAPAVPMKRLVLLHTPNHARIIGYQRKEQSSNAALGSTATHLMPSYCSVPSGYQQSAPSLLQSSPCLLRRWQHSDAAARKR